MMSDQAVTAAAQAPKREDARDLLSRLYREIGVLAVAAELQTPADVKDIALFCEDDHDPAIVEVDVKAA